MSLSISKNGFVLDIVNILSQLADFDNFQGLFVRTLVSDQTA